MAGRLDSDSLLLLSDALARLEQGFAQLPDNAADAGDPTALRETLLAAAERLRDNYPYFHPQYAGQMLKPPHAIARLAPLLPEKPRERLGVAVRREYAAGAGVGDRLEQRRPVGVIGQHEPAVEGALAADAASLVSGRMRRVRAGE